MFPKQNNSRVGDPLEEIEHCAIFHKGSETAANPCLSTAKRKKQRTEEVKEHKGKPDSFLSVNSSFIY